MASELTYRTVNSAYLRLFFLGERSLRSGKLGDCDAVWRTTNVTQADLVAKTDRVRIAAMLAADSHLQVPSGAPAFAGGYAHQRAHTLTIDGYERILGQQPLQYVSRQELSRVIA